MHRNKPLIIILLLAVVIALIFLFGFPHGTADESVQDDPNTANEMAGPIEFAPVADSWPRYQHPQLNFSLKYPAELTLSVSGTALTAEHSIPYEGIDPCARTEAAASGRLTDFDLIVRLHEGGLVSALGALSGQKFVDTYVVGHELTTMPHFIERVVVGDKEGYRLTDGIHSCWVYTYYLPLDNDHTLYARRSTGSLSAIDFDLPPESLNEAILPEDEEQIVAAMLSSVEVK